MTRLICRSWNKWLKQVLAIRVMCCFIDSSVSWSTPGSRTTSTGLRMLESSCNVRSLPETFFRICFEPNQISSVLSVFNCKLRHEHQFLTSEMQCWSVDRAWSMSCTSTSTYACLSSAYRWCLTPCFLKTATTSWRLCCRVFGSK